MFYFKNYLLKNIQLDYWKLFLIILTFCQSFLLSGQKENLAVENLENPSNKKIKKYIKKAYDIGLEKKFDSATYYYEKAFQLSKEINNPDLIAYSKLIGARILYWQANTNEAKSIASKVLVNNLIKDSIKVSAHFLYGEIYSYEKSYIQSLQHYLNIEKIISKNTSLSKRDSSRITSSFYNIGKIHFELNNIEKTKTYYDKALVYVKDLNFRSYILFKIANLYEDMENTSEAIKYSLKATEIASKNKWQLMLPTYYAGLSKNYIKVNKGDSAIYYSKKGLHNNTYCRLNWLNANIGEAYLINKNYPESIKYLKIALEYTTPDETLEVYELLREAYTQSKQYELALVQNDKFLVLKDSLDKLKVKQEIVAITEKYEADKKQLKIEGLSEKNELNDLVISKQKAQLISSVLLLVLTMVILVLITSFYFKQRGQKNLLYIKNRDLAQKLEARIELNGKTKLSGIENSQKNEIHNFINRLIDVEFYLDKDITLQKMAKKVNTNTSYLSKIINEDFNKSFASFINDLRISYTLKKLESFPEYRKLTVDHIGDKAGFSSINAFYRAFNKYTGLTPSYYIKRRLLQD